MKIKLLLLGLLACLVSCNDTKSTGGSEPNEPADLFENCDEYVLEETTFTNPYYGGLYPTTEHPFICGRLGPGESDINYYPLDWFAPSVIYVNAYFAGDPGSILSFDLLLGIHDPTTGDLVDTFLLHRMYLDPFGEAYITGLEVPHSDPLVYGSMWIVINGTYSASHAPYKYQIWD